MRRNRTSTAKVERRTSAAVIVLLRAIGRMAETAADAVDGPAAAGVIVDAAGAVDVLVVGEGIAADAAGRAGEGTKNLLPWVFADNARKATERVVAFSLPRLGTSDRKS